MLGIMPADRQEMQKLDAQTHRGEQVEGSGWACLLVAVNRCASVRLFSPRYLTSRTRGGSSAGRAPGLQENGPTSIAAHIMQLEKCPKHLH